MRRRRKKFTSGSILAALKLISANDRESNDEITYYFIVSSLLFSKPLLGYGFKNEVQIF